MSEEKTPNGMNKEGYQQAIENYAYQIEQLAHQLEAAPGELGEKLADFLGRGPLFETMADQIETLDNIVVVIADTYGYSEDQVEKDTQQILEERTALAFLNFMGNV